MSSSIWRRKIWGRLPCEKIEVVFHSKEYLGRLTLKEEKLRSSSICQNIEVVFHLKKIEVVFHLIKIRSSSIFKKNEVVFHISTSWVGIRLHTKDQLSRLPGSGLKLITSVWWWCGVFLPIIMPHQPSCFGLGCWLGCGQKLSPELFLFASSGAKLNENSYHI